MAEDEPATNGVPAREVARFLEESVRFAGEEWVDIFHTVSADPNLTVLGPEPGMLGVDDPQSLNNLRMLEAALDREETVHGVSLGR